MEVIALGGFWWLSDDRAQQTPQRRGELARSTASKIQRALGVFDLADSALKGLGEDAVGIQINGRIASRTVNVSGQGADYRRYFGGD